MKPKESPIVPAPEIVLRFSGPHQVSVSYDGDDSGQLPFANPVTDEDRRNITWYVEVYGTRSLADPDDGEARRIRARLAEIGKALFKAVFGGDNRAAERLFNRFQDADAEHRVLTIDSQSAAILSLPWELLHDPTGVYLFREHPHISVRRRISGASGGRSPFAVRPKETLHLLFVVSRPDDAGFIDPRADSAAVIEALEEYAPGRVTWEFLRPPTLDALVERLRDQERTAIDILHFDGHGAFVEVSEQDLAKEPHRYGRSVQSEIQREREVRETKDADAPIGIGFLVFERPDGNKHLISAQDLADNLFRARVSLLVLSACQTAVMHVEGDPMASVAGRLTSTGIPAILAMTHSVLAVTTRDLFGRFYQSLARGQGIAGALDDARAWLANHPEKFEVRRGNTRRMLELDDWFLPALFHAGADTPLLAGSDPANATRTPRETIDNLRPRHETGFFGRRQELWKIERWLAGGTRRVSITGFGGQGKTELALEAGRWLLRTGMFERAVFVDYAQVQSDDALGVAVSTIAVVLDETLVDTEAAGTALAAMPTLVILDNLENIAREPLVELLDAAAQWTQRGATRLLLTSREPDHEHPDYRIEGTHKHRRLELDGLGSAARPDDALDWYAALAALPSADDGLAVPPPTRDDLVTLFDRVAFHPLSIAVLAEQLRTRSAKQLGQRLSALLDDEATSAIAQPGTPPSLIASLQLSLDRLTPEQRQTVRRLGVFQRGAFEDDLVAILWPDDPQQADAWPAVRRQLESAALIQVERVASVIPLFLRFHPTLAPLLWAGLTDEERDALKLAHRNYYFQIATYLYVRDSRAPDHARAIARRDLPNLLAALEQTLVAGDANAAEFVEMVNRFLSFFGRRKEATELARRAEQVSGAVGSRSWYLVQCNHGEQLLAAGRVDEAESRFRAILHSLGSTPSYELATTLSRLGLCHEAAGRSDLAEARYRESIRITLTLEQEDSVKQHLSTLYTDLADVLTGHGEYKEAKRYYQESLRLDTELGDLRGQGVVNGQLGTLAMREGDVVEAVRRHQDALVLARLLGEPGFEAVANHQLGIAFKQAGKLEDAERHFRESARLHEQLGDNVGLARNWSSLAVVCEASGRLDAAENWYHKAIAAKSDNSIEMAADLSNLADMLQKRPGRLAEARELAEQSLAIEQTRAAGTVEIWKTYNILAAIAEGQSRGDEATEYRRLAREAKRRFAGTAHEVRRHAAIVAMVVGSVNGNVDGVAETEQLMQHGMERGGQAAEFARVVRRILDGERDPGSLVRNLHTNASPMVETILKALADPSVLDDLLHDAEDDH